MWSRVGQHALRSGPWVIARMVADGVARYALSRDGDEYEWCRVRLTRARYFDSAAAAKAAAEQDERQGEAGDGTD